MFTDKQVFISDYGWRHSFMGRTQCGTNTPKFLWIPARPQIDHAAVRLLWAITIATAIKQDRVTRRETVEICKRVYDHSVDGPCMWSTFHLAPTASIQGYWRDLYRHGFIRQYRRTWGPGSDQHFDVVYELTSKGRAFLEEARTNTLRDGIGGPDYPAMSN